MITYTDECVDCGQKPCLGSRCPNRNIPHHVCDWCGEEEKLYVYDGMQLCIDCIKETLEEV